MNVVEKWAEANKNFDRGKMQVEKLVVHSPGTAQPDADKLRSLLLQQVYYPSKFSADVLGKLRLQSDNHDQLPKLLMHRAGNWAGSESSSAPLQRDYKG